MQDVKESMEPLSNYHATNISTYTEKNLTLKSNLFQRSEATMCFEVESKRIRVDSNRKLNLIQYKVEFNLIFQVNQLEFLLLYLQNMLLIKIVKKSWILVSSFSQCSSNLYT